MDPIFGVSRGADLCRLGATQLRLATPFIVSLECHIRLRLGPARKSTFINAAIRISVSNFIPYRQPSASLSRYVTARCTVQLHTSLSLPPNARPTPPPPRLPVQTDSRRACLLEAGAVLTGLAIAPRSAGQSAGGPGMTSHGGRGVATRIKSFRNTTNQKRPTNPELHFM